MKYRILIVAATVLIALLALQAAQAGVFGAGLGGALRGAIVGDLIGGRDGAEAGAILGGVIGASEAASQKKRQKRQRQEAQRRQAEWARQQEAERARIQQQQAAAAPALAANQTLVVETQKSLIRLGYEPGQLGTAGPQLTQAVMNYQKSKGLLETGELSQALLTHMLRNGG